jgi:hypothetical protein
MVAFLNNIVTLYPGKSYMHNIGFDSQGTHCGETDIFNIILNTKHILKKIKAIENLEIKKCNYFIKKQNSLYLQE